MTDQPITRAQLDALERVADKVFGKLGIDIEFTHHFLDRVNDERNQKQITIRELGQLFAKEYQRWGGTISGMAVDAQAVMKDLSSAINIPFVLNKDGKEKDLVAKTVMRKKNFTTPDKTLPVESIAELGNNDPKKQKWDVVQKGNGKVLATFDMRALANRHYWVEKGWATIEPHFEEQKMAETGMTKDARARDIEQSDREYIVQKQFRDKWKKENPGKPWPGYHNAGFNDSTVSEEMRGAKKGNFVDQRIDQSGKRPRKGTVAYEIWLSNKRREQEWVPDDQLRPHDDYIGNARVIHKEALESDSPKQFVKRLRNDGWTVYASKINHSVRGANRLEFEKDGIEFEIIGTGSNWEVFFGPNLSGRGETYSTLQQAFNASSTGNQVGEELDQPPFTVRTPKPSQIADKHEVDIDLIKQQLRIGIDVEMEHTTDRSVAMEIALDHLNEMPDYYSQLGDMESEASETFIKGAWEAEQIRERMTDPREAILRKALQYLDAMVKSKGTRQDISGYAFDIVRSFNLNDTLNARELANLYREWKAS